MKKVTILAVLFLVNACHYHVPSNDNEFFDMCMGSMSVGFQYVNAHNDGADKYCLRRIEMYHENSKAKGRIPYNGDTSVFNYRYW